MKPLNKHLHIEFIEPESSRTASGLEMVGDRRDCSYQLGKVLAVADDIPDIKEGDIVYANWLSGYSLDELDNDRVKIIEYKYVILKQNG